MNALPLHNHFNQVAEETRENIAALAKGHEVGFNHWHVEYLDKLLEQCARDRQPEHTGGYRCDGCDTPREEAREFCASCNEVTGSYIDRIPELQPITTRAVSIDPQVWGDVK